MVVARYGKSYMPPDETRRHRLPTKQKFQTKANFRAISRQVIHLIRKGINFLADKRHPFPILVTTKVSNQTPVDEYERGSDYTFGGWYAAWFDTSGG